tara:strand:+ start:94 stop:222 length:129 start_codon:yes stop_codon:yes gene_type:complete
MDQETINALFRVTEVKQINAQLEENIADYAYYGQILDLLNKL